MPFSFNSLSTDAGVAAATVPGQTPVAAGSLPQSAGTPSDASFDSCLAQAKQPPTLPSGRTPVATTAKAPTDASKPESDTHVDDADEDGSEKTTSPTQGAGGVDPLACLNNLIGLIPTLPAAQKTAAETNASGSDTTTDTAEGGTTPGIGKGFALPGKGAQRFSKLPLYTAAKNAATPAATPLDPAAVANASDATEATSTETKADPKAAVDVAVDAQTATDVPANPLSTAAPLNASLRGPKVSTPKALARMLGNGSYKPTSLATDSTSAAASNGIPGDVKPASGRMQSLRAMMLTAKPAPDASGSTLAVQPQPLVDLTAQTNAAALAAAATASVPGASTVPAVTTDSSTQNARSTRDLLASGAPVIEYFVSPDQSLAVRVPKGAKSGKNDSTAFSTDDSSAGFTSADGTTAAVTSATTVPSWGSPVASDPRTDVPTVPDKTSVVLQPTPPVTDDLNSTASVADTVKTAAVVQTDASGNTPVAPRFDGINQAAMTSQAKIAAGTEDRVSALGSGDKSSTRGRKNTTLVINNKEVTQRASGVGTDTAKQVSDMPNSSPVHPENNRASDPFLSLTGSSTAPTNASNSSAAETASSNPTLSSHAAQAVREIRDIADGLWAVDRSSVEVRFNFTETEKLSVRVEYKDGAVHTTFRTDSPELRDTLARDWQTQTPTAGSDVRPYRVVDPVFGSGSSNNDQRSGFAGGDASRQQQPQQRSFEQSAGNASLSFSSSRSSGSSTVAVPNATQRISRTDTSTHLNVFA